MHQNRLGCYALDLKIDYDSRSKVMTFALSDLFALKVHSSTEVTIIFKARTAACNFEIVPPHLSGDRAFWTDLRKWLIEKVLQSHQDLPRDSSFHVNVGTIQIPAGGRSNKNITQLTGPNNSIHLKWDLLLVSMPDILLLAQTCKGPREAPSYY